MEAFVGAAEQPINCAAQNMLAAVPLHVVETVRPVKDRLYRVTRAEVFRASGDDMENFSCISFLRIDNREDCFVLR